ncbi:MAG: asparaginyl-tRNA synthetase [Parcubacteria group bacterium Gr01-1014_18]|nr:MAG: asparaginyl-tRNA synthetase [Parcubacteria group bacterium Greene0416_36]TSC80933.1 MAG: asparaginyl-tRNA synthetase [Parcubacteria group bacterium Gr01-1014_18]TSC98724.1 MAG: asparaginyl-tRNA synthetase [Parcubacteria group bacterium Greene1014_20]TSD06476.1 MAG: asparaginyl-tRNA synthetase [Parcubacteria group bacterium Greene0714_2]
MKRDFIGELSRKVGEKVTLAGWVLNLRSSGQIMFLELRDGSGFIQAIVEKTSAGETLWNLAQTLTLESSIEVEGLVKKHPKKENVYELDVKSLRVVGTSPDYPIGKKEHGPDFLLENRQLWLRVPSQWAILRIRHLVKASLQEFYNSEGFVEIDTPTFTPTPCEGTTDLFEVQYFDRKAYLTQNGQLYLEALAMAHGKVYDLCPNFRAEKSKTRKHLTEFWTLNPELAFCEHEESLALQERAVKYSAAYILKHGRRELEVLERNIPDLEAVVAKPFIHYEYPDAIAELQKRGSAIKYGDDLGADDEVLLTQDSDVPVIVKNWPAEIKPFYMKRHPSDPNRVQNADMLASRGFGEIIGGGQREDDYLIMKKRMEDQKMPMEVFGWYLELRKYGSVPHCGFGMGIERLTRWMGGIHHIRETAAFPRMLNRITP